MLGMGCWDAPSSSDALQGQLWRRLCCRGVQCCVQEQGLPDTGDLGSSQLISAGERRAARRWDAWGVEQLEALAAEKGAVVWMHRWGGLGPSAASIERITRKWAGGPVWISPAGSLGNLCMGETQLTGFMAALA